MHLLELVSSFLDICPGVGLQGYMVAPFLDFYGTSVPFSIVAVPIYIPTSCVGGEPCFVRFPSSAPPAPLCHPPL